MEPVAKQNLGIAKPPRFAFIALLGGNAALAAGPLFVRLADVGPVAAGFWRLALALPLLLLFALRTSDREDWRGARAAGGLAIVGGLFFAADLAAWHVGIHATKMANATLFGNAASLVLAATTLVVARRLPHRLEGAALMLAGTGAAILLRTSGQQGEARLVGDLLCLLAGFLYAGYMLTMQRARGRLSSWHALLLASAAGVVPLLLLALFLGEAIVPGDWTPVVLLALLSQIVGQGLLIYALPHFSALVVGLCLLTQPAVAALIGWARYGEALSAAEIVAGAMIGAALVLVRLPARASTGGSRSATVH